jgi:hypothetical protein
MNCSQKKIVRSSNKEITMPGAMKKTAVKGSVAKTFDAKKLMPKMTAQDAAMLKLLKKKYGADVYKG